MMQTDTSFHFLCRRVASHWFRWRPIPRTRKTQLQKQIFEYPRWTDHMLLTYILPMTFTTWRHSSVNRHTAQDFDRCYVERLTNSVKFTWYGRWTDINPQGFSIRALERVHQVDQVAANASGKTPASEHRRHRAVVKSHRWPMHTRVPWSSRNSRRWRTARNFIHRLMHTEDISDRAQNIHFGIRSQWQSFRWRLWLIWCTTIIQYSKWFQTCKKTLQTTNLVHVTLGIKYWYPHTQRL